jgi:hypothetical protein
MVFFGTHVVIGIQPTLLAAVVAVVAFVAVAVFVVVAFVVVHVNEGECGCVRDIRQPNEAEI